MTILGHPQPWEFQPGIDHADSYAAFCIYLRFPAPRRIRDVQTATRRAYGTIGDWSRTNLWADRALAWDRHVQTILNQATETEHRKTAAAVAARHAELTSVMLDIAQTELAKLHFNSAESATPVLSVRDLTRMTKEATTLERLAANLPTEIHEGKRLDFSKLNDSELAELDRLMQKAAPDTI